MKKLFLIIGLAVSLLAAQAAQVTVVTAANVRTNNLITTGGALSALTVLNTNAATVLTLAFFDSSNTNQTYIVTAHTNRIGYLTNIVTSWTDINGVANVMTNNAMAYIDSTVASNTYTLPKPLMLVVPANTTYTYTPATPLFFGRGILMTNDASCTVTATYSSVK